jgi:hypothetical protein
MTSGPEEPFRGTEYPPLENAASRPADPYAPVDYPTDAGLPPPVYPAPYPGPPGYPGAPTYPAAPGYPSATGYPGAPGYPGGYPDYPYRADPYDPYRPAKPPGTNGKAIAALVTALAGLLCCGLPSIAGPVLGIIAMRETKRTGQDGYGIALAGAIIGGLVAVLWVAYLVVIIAIAATSGSYTSGIS